MSLSYRTRRRLSYVGICALILLMIAIMLWMVWIIWLDRYVVYNRDGAQLRFDLDLSQFSGQQAVEPAPGETVPIYYNEGSFAVDLDNELTQLRGYYADTDAIRKNFTQVREQIERLPAGTAVMLDMKNIAGYFYYSTTLGGKTSDKVDIGAMDELIDYLRTDICNCGGITEMRKIAAYGETHYMEMVPHGVEHVGFLASMHVDFAVPNFICQEDWLSRKHPSWLDYDVTFKDGYLTMGDRPGLGIDIDFDALEPIYTYEHPHWRRADGTVQDW